MFGDLLQRPGGGRGKGEEGNLMGRGEGGGYITNGVHEKQKGGGIYQNKNYVLTN